MTCGDIIFHLPYVYLLPSRLFFFKKLGNWRSALDRTYKALLRDTLTRLKFYESDITRSLNLVLR